ncbi:hypothetical protein [Photobacterium sp.]|uniref:hypothetical protein n=1 Tax=Photobacterium sp. TaxID=660 RepID=UPI00299ED1CD|nr:hypothetical protein [Photobacterium sp.]MDX1303035.1 hypothetical protein [Photobacterium sp.]
MKYKYIIYAAIAVLIITLSNYLLWHKDSTNKKASKEITETTEQAQVPQEKISDNYEYPAPVKQLQQVLVKSYQPPVHEGEEFFPDDLLKPDEETSAKAGVKVKIDQLRERIETIKRDGKVGS